MPTSIHYPDMAGFAELKLMECWRSLAFDVRGFDDRPPRLDCDGRRTVAGRVVESSDQIVGAGARTGRADEMCSS
jgi:hypothetical protein